MALQNNKDTLYFSHDGNARRDPKMIALRSVYGAEGYGWWWILVEILREQNGYKIDISKKFAFASLAAELGTTREKAQEFIDCCLNELDLLKTDDAFIWSESLLKRMSVLDEKRKRLSERGKKGAEITNQKKLENSAQANEESGTSESQAGESGAYDSQNDKEASLTVGKQSKESKESKQSKESKESKDSPGSDEPWSVSLVSDEDPELKSIYAKVPKDSKHIVAFIKEHQPRFILPFVDLWNLFAAHYQLPQVAKINSTRQRKFKKRIAEKGFDFPAVIRKASQSDFLMQGRWFTFDWIMENDTNYQKVIEGQYDNKKANAQQNESDIEAYKRQRAEKEERTKQIAAS